MENPKFDEIKKSVQHIIDCIAVKNAQEALLTLADVSDELDELLDYSDEDDDLIEISKYQVLLNQLQQKIVGLNDSSSMIN